MKPKNKILEDNQIYLTDGGLETTLIFKNNIDLPHFSAFTLLASQEGLEVLRAYYRKYLDVAQFNDLNFILETPTWRANADWAELLGIKDSKLSNLNTIAVHMLHSLRTEYQSPNQHIIVSGCIGPRSDGYNPTMLMSDDAACAYHLPQIKALAKAGVDMINAMTISYIDEAIGLVKAAKHENLPICIAFTVETNGHLIDGTSLKQAIEMIDSITSNGPAYYMINCAHPDHFSAQLNTSENWINRIGGIRANASRLSHAELDECEKLDTGNPLELGQLYSKLAQILPELQVVGGCCGTDEYHITHISQHFRKPKGALKVS